MSATIGFDLPDQVASLVGTTILPSLVYGINSILVFMTLGLLWKGRTTNNRKRSLLMTNYISLIFVLCTAHWVLSCVAEGISLVEIVGLSINPSYQVDNVIFRKQLYVTYAIDIIYVVVTWLTDGLLVRVWSRPCRLWTLTAYSSGDVGSSTLAAVGLFVASPGSCSSSHICPL